MFKWWKNIWSTLIHLNKICEAWHLVHSTRSKTPKTLLNNVFIAKIEIHKTINIDIFTWELESILKKSLTKTPTNLEWSNTEIKILQYWHIFR